jgi:hypothetical protein
LCDFGQRAARIGHESFREFGADGAEQRRERVAGAGETPLDGSPVDAQAARHFHNRAMAGRQQHFDQFPDAGHHGDVGRWRDGGQELVRVRPEQRVGYRVRRGQIAGAKDDPGKLTLEFHRTPEDPQVGTDVRGRRMREAHSERPPPRTVQLAVKAVERADRQFGGLADAHRLAEFQIHADRGQALSLG